VTILIAEDGLNEAETYGIFNLCNIEEYIHMKMFAHQ